MSTKIYNAYEYRPDGKAPTLTSLVRLNGLLLRFRAVCLKFRSTTGYLSGDPSMRLPMLSVMDRHGHHARELTDDAVVYLGIPNRIFVQFFAGNILNPAIKRTRSLVDFHYQDQADQARNVSRAAWEERRQVWDRILGKPDGIPAVGGFTFHLSSIDLVRAYISNHRN